MDQYQEGLIAIAIYLFFLSAVCLPVLIIWFTHQMNKRIRRIDNILDVVEEGEKYHEKNNNTTESG